jgi:hypothetical protein
MFAKAPGDVIPGTREEIGVKKTMFTIFCTNEKLSIAKYLPKGQKHTTMITSSQISFQSWNEKK